MTVFAIDDEFHGDRVGEYPTLVAAWGELKRLVALPFDQEPNLPPCTKGAGCRRTYEIAEYDDSKEPWTELSRTFVVELTAAGAEWKVAPPEGV